MDKLDYFNHIMTGRKSISRRDFLALSAITLSGLAFNRMTNGRSLLNNRTLPQLKIETPDFPENIQLGRMCVGEPGANVDIKSEPYWNASSLGTAYYDDVFLWKQEVIARQLDQNRINQRWVETPEGYIYADYLQKVKHIPQEPLNQLPEIPDGGQGMWVEVVTPFTGLDFAKPPSQHWARTAVRPRIYYSQVFWAFNIRQDPVSDSPQYLLKQLHGAFDDAYWVAASICRQITPEEIAPINPDAEDKRIVVDLNYQNILDQLI